MKDKPEAIQQFIELVAVHDVDYQRHNGVDEKKASAGWREWLVLFDFAKAHLTYPVARRIWNANVCYVFNRQDLREHFFWPPTPSGKMTWPYVPGSIPEEPRVHA